MIEIRDFPRLGTRLKASLSIILLILLGGCATLGQEFDHRYVDQLVVDETRKAEVIQMLGEPWRTGRENGLETWTYGHYKFGVFRDEFAKDLVLKFDKQGILRFYSFNTTERELEE